MTKDFTLEKVEKMLNAGCIEIPVENLVNYINFLTDYTEEINLVKATVVGGRGKNKHKHYLVIQGQGEDVLDYDEEKGKAYNKYGVVNKLETLSAMRSNDLYEFLTSAELKSISDKEGVLLVIPETNYDIKTRIIKVKVLEDLNQYYYKNRLFYLDKQDLEDIIDFENIYTRPTTHYPTLKGLEEMGLSKERAQLLMQYENNVDLAGFNSYVVTGSDFDILGIERPKNKFVNVVAKLQKVNWLQNKVLFNDDIVLDIETTYKLLRGYYHSEGVH